MAQGPLTVESTLADLTGSCRHTTGNIPPPLVGASVTVVGNKCYVFGGRLVPRRILTSDVYALDLTTLVWEKVWPKGSAHPSASVQQLPRASVHESIEELDTKEETAGISPTPRYFHSADAHDHLIYVFGGMGCPPMPLRAQSPAESVSSRTSRASSKRSQRSQSKPPPPIAEVDLAFVALSDLAVFDTITNSWSYPNPPIVPHSASSNSPTSAPRDPYAALGPTARYAHLSCVTNNCLIIIGGQDNDNRYLQEVSVLDLERMVWVETRRFEGHCGTYRSIAVSRPVTVHPASDTSRRKSVTVEPTQLSQSQSQSSFTSQPTSRTSRPSSRLSASTPGDGTGLVQLSYSAPPTRDQPEPIWLFTNFSFANVKRSLDMVSAPRSPNFACPVTRLTHLMTSGPALPPGLRFPSGAVVGNFLVVAGTCLSPNAPGLAIWALDLSAAPRGGKLHWQKLDPGSVLSGGASWAKSVAWRNTLVVFGDRDRDIVQDYEHRQLNWKHAVFVDLEAFGIYHPPLRLMPPMAQELGLASLANASLNDFEIVCADGRRLGCNRKLLEERWTWFKEEMSSFRNKTRQALSSLSAKQSATHNSFTAAALCDMRLSPRTLDLPEPSHVVFAALQYFYTLSLVTPLQHQTNTLIGLFFFARTYQVPNLRALAVHALHSSVFSSAATAASIYEACTLAGANALQIRALKKMMVSSSRNKMEQEKRKLQQQQA